VEFNSRRGSHIYQKIALSAESALREALFTRTKEQYARRDKNSHHFDFIARIKGRVHISRRNKMTHAAVEILIFTRGSLEFSELQACGVRRRPLEALKPRNKCK
jgi:hypothetical protein